MGGKPGVAEGEDEVGGHLPSRRVRGGPGAAVPDARVQPPSRALGLGPGA